MKQIISIFIFLISAGSVSSQVIKRSIAISTKPQVSKPLAVLPPALVFARTPLSNYQWGALLSEDSDIITVDFLEGWGKCVINKNGRVLSTTGNFNVKDSMYVIDILEERYELTDPANQLPQAAIARIAYAVNYKPYNFAGYTPFDAGSGNLTVYPVAYMHTKYCNLKFLQNKWSISYSQLPEFVVGSNISDIYYYTHKTRNFYRQH